MRIFAACLGWVLAATCLAAPVDIETLRMWPAPDHTRLVFDISGPVEHKIFTLAEPDRVVLDFRHARLRSALVNDADPQNLVAGIRSAARNGSDLRVVLDLKARVRPKSFFLKPNSSYGHRLVLDLFPRSSEGAEPPQAVKRTASQALRDVVIAIDPGHGGEDPGALGPGGVREKHVTLAVSRRLADLIDAERGMRPVLIRTGDYYVGLRRRMQIAREHRADLFVSIHADAFRDPRVHGSSVYILSRTGASSEAARWLAEQENAADLVGGVSLDDKDDLLASVLLDLSQTATLSASNEAGAVVLDELKRLGKTHKPRVQHAGFVVLKSPDIPSILVEAAFLSNPAEERRLSDPAHQQSLAHAILVGIRRHFDRHAPPGSLLALRKHVIARGDTLSDIAARYRVSVASLRQANALNGDHLNVGQVLRIPNPQGG